MGGGWEGDGRGLGEGPGGAWGPLLLLLVEVLGGREEGPGGRGCMGLRRVGAGMGLRRQGRRGEGLGEGLLGWLGEQGVLLPLLRALRGEAAPAELEELELKLLLLLLLGEEALLLLLGVLQERHWMLWT